MCVGWSLPADVGGAYVSGYRLFYEVVSTNVSACADPHDSSCVLLSALGNETTTFCHA